MEELVVALLWDLRLVRSDCQEGTRDVMPDWFLRQAIPAMLASKVSSSLTDLGA